MKDLTEVIQEYGLEFLGSYYSCYRGLVVNNKDPENRARLHIQIPNVMGGIRVWALSKSQIGGNGWGAKFITPLVGDTVWVEFLKGDPLQAVWSHHGWSKNTLPEELSQNMSMGFITPSGNKVILEDDKGKLTIRIGSPDEEETGTTIVVDQKITTVNGGNNKGLVNIEPLRKLITAIQQDLIVAQSGTNVSKWMADPEGYAKLEDTNFNH